MLLNKNRLCSAYGCDDFILQLQFTAYETSVAYLLNTTDDNVVESPDETLTVAIYVAGMFPSFLGDLIAVVSIEVSKKKRIENNSAYRRRPRKYCNRSQTDPPPRKAVNRLRGKFNERIFALFRRLRRHRTLSRSYLLVEFPRRWSSPS